MTFKDDAVAALREGHNSDFSSPNPYTDTSPRLARIWLRGHRTMRTIRVNSTPARQAYLQAGGGTG